MEVLTIANNAASELAKKRQKIAKYELEVSETLNLGKLRELASGLVLGSSKMKKAKLAEELIGATKTERKISSARSVIPNLQRAANLKWGTIAPRVSHLT